MSAMHRASAPDSDSGTGTDAGQDHEGAPCIAAQAPIWAFDAVNDAPDTAGPSNTPHVSLFSSGPSPASSQTPPDGTAILPRARVGSSPPSNSSRPLSALAGAAAMTRRTARLKVSDERPQSPIAPLTSRIPSVQKDADDPTTPVDSRRSDHGRYTTTLTTLSRLFAGDATMSTSRPSSHNTATASTEAVPLPDHLYTRGLLEGRHSDITVIAFEQRYNLHRLILDRAPFFTLALSEPWIESQSKEVTLYPEEIDSSITQAAFELAIKKLYGCDISNECDVEAVGLFATGCWLEMQDLTDASIESILRQMTPNTLSPLIRLVTSNYYGRNGDRILESAKAMLSRNGWEMPLKYWDGMPGDVIRELVASDGFFVDSEWDRWVLAKRLLDRRLRQHAIDAGLIERGQKPVPKAPDSLRLMAVRFDAVYRQNALTVGQAMSDTHSAWLALYTNPDIERILVLLDEGIHYVHMEYEQMDFIRSARDVFGLPVMPERVISNALWQQLSLRQRVLSASESDQELGLSKPAPEPATTARIEERPSSKGKHKAVLYTPEEEDEDDLESDSWDQNGKPRKFWIPSSDCNIVLGNGADPVVTTSSSFQRHASRLSASLQPEDVQWATDFASSPSTMTNPNTREHPMRPTSAGGSNAGQPRSIAYTEFPPFRFSAEFPNPRFLKEKKRVYSRTVSYAGSLWNIYIQKVRSAKNVQLGVYLHRAKEREADETVSGSSLSQQTARSVDERIGQLEREMLLRRANRVRISDQTVEDDTSGSGGEPDSSTLVSSGARNPLFSSDPRRIRASNRYPRSPLLARASASFQNLATSPPPPDAEAADSSPFYTTTTTTAFSASDEHDSDLTSSDDEPPPNPSLSTPSSTLTAAAARPRKTRSFSSTLPTYVDGRPTIRTYFKIYSPSKGGRMLSIYESAPDRFNFSQSWGWKSSTLMLDEVMVGGGGGDESGGTGGGRKKGDGKLRFMVVIGNL